MTESAGSQTSAADLDAYFEGVRSEGVYPHPGNLRFYTRLLFQDISLRGASFLEIGGGSGYLSFYAAFAGARRVVCLEPGSAGSENRRIGQFEALARRFRRPEVSLRPETLQDFDPGGERFDVLLLNSSINHLDEEACIRLHDDPEARHRYHKLFEKLATLTKPGGRLVTTDASRYNVLGSLGLPHPLARHIDWHKHQTPWVWARLLAASGFTQARIDWVSPNTLRTPGQILFGNVVGAFLMSSQFRLVMTRA